MKKLKYLKPLSKIEFEEAMASDEYYLSLLEMERIATLNYKEVMEGIAAVKRKKNQTPVEVLQYNKCIDRIESLRKKLKDAEAELNRRRGLVDYSFEEHRTRCVAELEQLHRRVPSVSRQMTIAKNKLSTYVANCYRKLAQARIEEKRK